MNGEDLPRISIVVPSFNQGRFIGHTLQSLIDQRYPKLEIIVVDGGSTDDTVSEIKRFDHHLTWWTSEPDEGQTSAINKGFGISTGDIMAWINSDDLVAPGALHYVGHYFLQNPQTQIVYGNRVLINDEGLEVGRWVLPGHSTGILKWVDFVPQETLYWRRSAWEAVGACLDERFHFAMDWDFLLRLVAAGLEIQHTPKFLGYFRVHEQQKSRLQIFSLGQIEMQSIRERELGFQPSRNHLRWKTAAFLLRSRLCELGFQTRIGR